MCVYIYDVNDCMYVRSYIYIYIYGLSIIICLCSSLCILYIFF